MPKAIRRERMADIDVDLDEIYNPSAGGNAPRPDCDEDDAISLIDAVGDDPMDWPDIEDDAFDLDSEPFDLAD